MSIWACEHSGMSTMHLARIWSDHPMVQGLPPLKACHPSPIRMMLSTQPQGGPAGGARMPRHAVNPKARGSCLLTLTAACVASPSS